MQRIIIISFLLLKGVFGFTQNHFNDSLLFYELKYFNCTNDTLRQEILLKKIDLYFRANTIDARVLKEVERIKSNLLKGNSQSFFLWNAGLVAYLNSDDQASANYFRQYQEISGDTALTFYLASALANKNIDTLLFKRQLRVLTQGDTLFNGLTCFLELHQYNRKHLNFYLLASAILPGSGTLMNGSPAKGIVSLALAAGSVFAIVKMVEYGLYINAALWGAGVGMKFYAGNIKLTEASFYKTEDRIKKKLAENCELHLNLILIKYPLNLKRL